MIPKNSRAEGFKIFDILLAATKLQAYLSCSIGDTGPMMLMDLALADGEPEDSITARIEPVKDIDIQRKCADMTKILKNHCFNLIQIGDPDHDNMGDLSAATRINFINTSFIKYLQEHHESEYHSRHVNDSLNPYLSLLSLSLYHLKPFNKPSSRDLLWYFVRVDQNPKDSSLVQAPSPDLEQSSPEIHHQHNLGQP